MVQILAPYTRVIKDEPGAHEPAADGHAPEPDATQAFVEAQAAPAEAAKPRAVRIRKPGSDDAPM
jgi:hypothetical protein